MNGASARRKPTRPPQRLHELSSERVERVFHDCFAASFNTHLVGGASEPLYQPAATDRAGHTVYYRHDYFASALHEVAHWCIAGRQRRTAPDYGYWYVAGERGPAQQRAFEAAERRPQALEWVFSRACGWPFSISVDNLDVAGGAIADTTAFRSAVVHEACRLRDSGLPPRARCFFDALVVEFHCDAGLADMQFSECMLS